MVNTNYRKEGGTGARKGKPRNKKRIPFSFGSLIASPAFSQIASVTDATREVGHGPRKIDLGSWIVDEVQLCEMGSKDHAGVYRSVGAISL